MVSGIGSGRVLWSAIDWILPGAPFETELPLQILDDDQFLVFSQTIFTTAAIFTAAKFAE